MDQTIQNIDIPQENPILPPVEKAETANPPKKLNPKIVILIVLTTIIFLSLFITSITQKSQPTTKSTKQITKPVSQTDTPTPAPQDPILQQLDNLKNKLNSLEEIPDLNIEEKLTF